MLILDTTHEIPSELSTPCPHYTSPEEGPVVSRCLDETLDRFLRDQIVEGATRYRGFQLLLSHGKLKP